MPSEKELLETRLRDSREVLAQLERAEESNDNISPRILRQMGVNPELTRYLDGGVNSEDIDKLRTYIDRLEQDLEDLRGGSARIEELQNKE